MGKGHTMADLLTDLLAATTSTTAKWTKQRKAEERGSRRDRTDAFQETKVDFTLVMGEILPDAYLHASGGGVFPAANRQIYYAARDRFEELTDRAITQQYLCQTLLPRFMNENPELTRDWKVTADARGKLIIPNTTSAPVPCGTLEIDQYLRSHVFHHESTDPTDDGTFEFSTRWPGCTPGERYQAVMYIEKEGFEPLLTHARIADRFNIAIVSCKGQSVVAARRYVDVVCGGRKIPLLTVHDFDLHGFVIASRLTTESDEQLEKGTCKYHFEHQFASIDIGLRLADVEEYGLPHEKFKPKNAIQIDAKKQRVFGMTDAEVKFLTERRRDDDFKNRRVELNAFTSPQFIEWIEKKLRQHGVHEHWMPAEHILVEQYKRATLIARLQRAVDGALSEYSEDDIIVPGQIEALTAAAIQSSGLPWDQAIAMEVKSGLRKQKLNRVHATRVFYFWGAS